MTRPPLVRATDDRLLAGVCGGLAAHLGLPPTAVRAGMLVLAALGGAGALLYLWLWATVPRAEDAGGVPPLRRALTRPAGDGAAPAALGAPAVPSATGGSPVSAAAPGAPETAPDPRAAAAGRAPGAPGVPRPAVPGASSAPAGAVSAQVYPAGAASGAAGGAAAAQATAPPLGAAAPSGAAGPGAPAASGESARAFRWPIAELLLGACLLIAGIGLVLVRLGVQINLEVILPAMAVLVGVGLTWWQIADRDRPDRNQVPRVLGALALVAAGVLMFFVTSREPSALTVIAAAFAVLAGVALAIAPWLLRLNRELIAERAARAREAERSDIAAHLHDSVLQTLALIQQRSDPGSEVARIARGQERELREWLFRTADGAPPPQREAAGQELRAHAAALEEEHPVRFEVVEVGASGVAPEAIVAAAREAMLNAARHAGGDVTVFLESRGERISIDVTDRGPGLGLEHLPAGRMGVRESILGRMERAGGTARIVPGPGGGTSVRLGIPREAAPGSDASTQERTSNDE
ncbi:ATP-binding protein [Leucobacter luti]|uniref:Phage shock protein C (PspC) family protein n=1 Tax=Leucobacter luti TaxID=340320 RepID=A0A4Q7TZA9_9MICO|nr:ATP-binding protein [Leucobacter luti]MBL3698935.1 ATP-binding protein [Leucobacter luti]RZT66313.1 phage shock protein C (PspC) family protein [Leucobacter luti]